MKPEIRNYSFSLIETNTADVECMERTATPDAVVFDLENNFLDRILSGRLEIDNVNGHFLPDDDDDDDDEDEGDEDDLILGDEDELDEDDLDEDDLDVEIDDDVDDVDEDDLVLDAEDDFDDEEDEDDEDF